MADGIVRYYGILRWDMRILCNIVNYCDMRERYQSIQSHMSDESHCYRVCTMYVINCDRSMVLVLKYLNISLIHHQIII